MKIKIFWFVLGFLVCISCVSIIATTNFGSTAGKSSSITTSADGKYVYIIGAFSDQYYRSEDYGKTFIKFNIDGN